jgi:hypothetical protein
MDMPRDLELSMLITKPRNVFLSRVLIIIESELKGLSYLT